MMIAWQSKQDTILNHQEKQHYNHRKLRSKWSHTAYSPCWSGQCLSSIRQNKHWAFKLSLCFIWEPCQIYPALSNRLRPPHKNSRLNNKTKLQTPCKPSIATALGHQYHEQKIYGLHKNHLLQIQQFTTLTMSWLQLMNPIQTSYVLCCYHQSHFGLIPTKHIIFLFNPAGET